MAKADDKPNTGASGRWRSRFTRTLAAGVKDRAQLVEMLAESQQRGVLDAEAFAMLEGVLEVADLQVRDIMVPRAQMVCLRRDDADFAHSARPWSSRGTRAFRCSAAIVTMWSGILLAKDLLRLFAGAEQTAIRHARVPAAGGVRARSPSASTCC